MQLRKKNRKKTNKSRKKSFISRSAQAIKPTIVASSLLLAASFPNPSFSDEISIEYLRYGERDDRVGVHAVSFDFLKELGTDDTIKTNFSYDTVSGGTPTWTDASSGGSQRTVGVVKQTGQVSPITPIYEITPFSDVRKSFDVLWTHRFPSRNELAVGASISKETDFLSFGASAEYRYLFNNANTTFSIGGSYLKNESKASFLPLTTDVAPSIANIYIDTPTKPYEAFDMFNAQVGLTQVLTKTSLINFNIFAIAEDGYLNNPYLRIIRNYTVYGGRSDNYLFEESRPDQRFALGVTLNYIKEFMGKYALHAGYRFYHDDWEVNSHSFELKVHADVTEDIKITPGFRYYTQDEAFFYGNIFPEKFQTMYSTTAPQEHASSDHRLGNYDSKTVDLEIAYKLDSKFTYNILGSYLHQSSGLKAIIFMSGIRYKF